MFGGLKDSDIDKIRAVFSNHGEIKQAILYGSRAKGTYKPYSDIDLALKGDLDLSKKWLIEFELDDLLLPYKMDISIFHQITDPDLISHINRIGKVFYQKYKLLIFTKVFTRDII
jgi:type I restriction enzyme S subunit